ncbi:MAG TPA: c-type cytochrome [Rubricoccaceae bacterium]|nr:c-type cytochrome [Rubricoccaceae bacterium]
MRLLLPLSLVLLLGACAAAYAGNPAPTPAPAPPAGVPAPATPASSPTAAAADTSGGFENLEVLPDSISHDRLMAVMQGFGRALGVRCTFCHARGAEGEPPDFPSDANPHKDVARDMMRMTAELNRDILPDIEGLHNPRVTCWTCHRGEPQPQTSAPAPEEGGSGG